MPLHFRRVHEQWALGSSVGSGCSLLVNMLGLAEVRVTVVLATGVGWHTGLTGLTARAQWSAAPAPTDTSTHPPTTWHNTPQNMAHSLHQDMAQLNSKDILMELRIFWFAQKLCSILLLASIPYTTYTTWHNTPSTWHNSIHKQNILVCTEA